MITIIEQKTISQITAIANDKTYLVVETTIGDLTDKTKPIVEIFETTGDTGEYKKVFVYAKSVWDFTPKIMILENFLSNDEQNTTAKTT